MQPQELLQGVQRRSAGRRHLGPAAPAPPTAPSACSRLPPMEAAGSAMIGAVREAQACARQAFKARDTTVRRHAEASMQSNAERRESDAMRPRHCAQHKARVFRRHQAAGNQYAGSHGPWYIVTAVGRHWQARAQRLSNRGGQYIGGVTCWPSLAGESTEG